MCKQSMPYVSWLASFLQWYLPEFFQREWNGEFSGRTFVIKPTTASVLKYTGYKYRRNIWSQLLMHKLWSNRKYICRVDKIFLDLLLCKRSIGESYHKINDLYIKKLCFVICTEKQCFVYIFNKPHKLFTFIMAIEIQTNCDICSYKL